MARKILRLKDVQLPTDVVGFDKDISRWDWSMRDVEDEEAEQSETETFYNQPSLTTQEEISKTNNLQKKQIIQNVVLLVKHLIKLELLVKRLFGGEEKSILQRLKQKLMQKRNLQVIKSLIHQIFLVVVLIIRTQLQVIKRVMYQVIQLKKLIKQILQKQVISHLIQIM